MVPDPLARRGVQSLQRPVLSWKMMTCLAQTRSLMASSCGPRSSCSFMDPPVFMVSYISLCDNGPSPRSQVWPGEICRETTASSSKPEGDDLLSADQRFSRILPLWGPRPFRLLRCTESLQLFFLCEVNRIVGVSAC